MTTAIVLIASIIVGIVLATVLFVALTSKVYDMTAKEVITIELDAFKTAYEDWQWDRELKRREKTRTRK